MVKWTLEKWKREHIHSDISSQDQMGNQELLNLTSLISDSEQKEKV